MKTAQVGALPAAYGFFLKGTTVMPYNPERHHRCSIRLQGYDYAQAGAYFVTVCVQDRECLLGEVAEDVVHLSSIGQVVEEEWLRCVHRWSWMLM